MEGVRLNPYRGFIREARNNATDVKPKDASKDNYGREKDLAGMNTLVVLSESRAHSLLCFLVYKKKNAGYTIYRPAVVPETQLWTGLSSSRIEIIDMKSMKRKTYYLSLLRKAVPTGRRVRINQGMITYAK